VCVPFKLACVHVLPTHAYSRQRRAWDLRKRKTGGTYRVGTYNAERNTCVTILFEAAAKLFALQRYMVKTVDRIAIDNG